MRLLPQLGLVALLGAAAFGGWYWIEQQSGQHASTAAATRQNRPTAVETVNIRQGSVTDTLSVIGSTRALKAVAIVPTVAGQITRITFAAGQQVATGAVLVELDAATEQAAVREADTELANLRRQTERAQALLTRKMSSTAEVDDLRAQTSAAEARLAAARSRLDKRTVQAPFAGVLGLRNVSVGDYVDTDTTLTTLDDLSVVELDFEVPERYYGALQRGQRLIARSVAFPERLFSGVVRDIDTRINPATRSFRVRAELPNPDTLLPDGLFMTASLTLAERNDVLLIPVAAVIAENEQRYVFVVQDDTALRVPIETGLRVGDDIEVRSGLTPDAVIVSKGHQKLRDNTPVRQVAHEGKPRTIATSS